MPRELKDVSLDFLAITRLRAAIAAARATCKLPCKMTILLNDGDIEADAMRLLNDQNEVDGVGCLVMPDWPTGLFALQIQEAGT